MEFIVWKMESNIWAQPYGWWPFFKLNELWAWENAQNPLCEGKHYEQPTLPYPTLTSSSVHYSSYQLTTTFLSYYNVFSAQSAVNHYCTSATTILKALSIATHQAL